MFTVLSIIISLALISVILLQVREVVRSFWPSWKVLFALEEDLKKFYLEEQSFLV